MVLIDCHTPSIKFCCLPNLWPLLYYSKTDKIMQKGEKKKKLRVGHLLCGREAAGMLELEGNFETMEPSTFILQIE